MKEKIALISVYNKDGIVELAQQLIDSGFKIVSSGGTATHLTNFGVPVTDVAKLVGGGPILGHRVVTLSREIHAGLLAKYGKDEEEMASLGIPYIDLVCCDFYPLGETIGNLPEEVKGTAKALEIVVEGTDIGGPTMLRSAAKGRRIVICEAGDRQTIINWLKEDCPNKEETINAFAAKAEFLVARYCLMSAKFLSGGALDGFFGEINTPCKYGENAYQSPAAFCKTPGNEDPLGLDKFIFEDGIPLSYNNYCDLDRLLQTMTHLAATFDVNYGQVPFIALGVKHGNACGAGASWSSEWDAIKKMVTGDSEALFGGLVMTNFALNMEGAEFLSSWKSENRRILDGVIAPIISQEAKEILRRKNGKCRIVTNKALLDLDKNSLDREPIFRYVRGGYLKQPNYTFVLNTMDERLKTHGVKADDDEIFDMLMAKAICDTSNSNTITIIKDGQLIGNGVGQQSRVACAGIAVIKAATNHHDLHGASAASDSFFPFPDGPAVLINAGITAIVSSSGSIKDNETIALCEEKEIALYLIPDEIGRGFYNH